MMWHDRGWDGGDWVGMGLLMVLFWGAVVFGGFWLVSRLRAVQPQTPSSARQILDDRLARGEIDAEEYRARRDVLDGR